MYRCISCEDNPFAAVFARRHASISTLPCGSRRLYSHLFRRANAALFLPRRWKSICINFWARASSFSDWIIIVIRRLAQGKWIKSCRCSVRRYVQIHLHSEMKIKTGESPEINYDLNWNSYQSKVRPWKNTQLPFSPLRQSFDLYLCCSYFTLFSVPFFI